MSTAPDARTHILKFLEPKLERAGIPKDQVTDESDLLELGILDSFDVVALFADVEQVLGIDADVLGADDSEFGVSIAWFCDAFERGAGAH